MPKWNIVYPRCVLHRFKPLNLALSLPIVSRWLPESLVRVFSSTLKCHDTKGRASDRDGDSASFLHLDIRVEENQFVYRLYDKRDAFPFSIVRMPYLSSNIPKKTFYSALVGEFLRIARATLYLSDFEPKALDLVKRMINQGGDQNCIERYLLKIIRRHPDSFSQFRTPPKDLVQKCFGNLCQSWVL